MKKSKRNCAGKLLLKIRVHLLNYCTQYTVLFFLFALSVFPVLVLWGAASHELVHSAMGDLLSYYGVAFGIFASVATYLMERRRSQIEKQKELRPKLQLEFKTIDSDEKAYVMTITNRGNKDLREIWVDGESLGLHMNAKDKITINVDCNDAQTEWYSFDNDNRSIYLPAGKQGFPKSIGVCCTDESDTMWCVEFTGYAGACGPVYSQKDMYMI